MRHLKLLLIMLLLQTGFSTLFAAEKVVVSIKPLYAITHDLLKGVDQPGLLMQQKVSPHHFSLKPSQAKKIQQASLIVWVGENIESALAKLFYQQPPEKMLSMSAFFQQDKHQQHSIHQNQHYWLDVSKMILFSKKLAERLQALYPQQIETIQKNLSNLLDRLQSLDKQIQSDLSAIDKRPFILIHNALYWFNQHYQLKPLAVVQHSEHQKPSLKHLLKIKQQLATQDHYCILADRQMNPKWARILSIPNHTKVAYIDPAGLFIEPAENAYFALMRQLDKSIVQCLRAH